MGKETGTDKELLHEFKESLAMMASFHLNAFINNPKQKDRPPEVRCTDKWIQHCTGCAAADQYRRAEKLLAAGEITQ